MARCPKHDLALTSDGDCLLCRRETAPRAQVPRSLFVIAGLALVVLAGIFVMKSRSRVVASAEPIVVAAVPPAVEPAPNEPNEPRLPPMVATLAARPARVERAPVAGTAVAPPAAVAPPTEADVRAALKEVPITVYSTTWCPQCDRARRWFRSNSISFVEYDVEANPAAERAQRKLNPAGSVPTMDIDGVVEIGFSEKRVGKAIAASVQRRLRQKTQ